MLYHVRDLERALNEVRRVLRPGGTFVAVTNGNDHLAELRIEAGGKRDITQFSSETGESVLRRRFADVRRHDLETRAVFPDHATPRPTSTPPTRAWCCRPSRASGSTPGTSRSFEAR